MYYTALKMFKIEMDYLSLKALAVKLIGSSLAKQQII